jgi:hypothetical protein
MSSLGACGLRSDGMAHIEVIGNRPGTSWIFDWFAADDRAARYKSIVIDPVSAAGSMVADLRALGLQVIEIGPRQLVTGCGKLFDLITSKQIRHIDQTPLNAAVAGAKRRPLGDAWAWHRRDTSVDVSPLVACTLALQGHIASELRPLGAPQILDPWSNDDD